MFIRSMLLYLYFCTRAVVYNRNSSAQTSDIFSNASCPPFILTNYSSYFNPRQPSILPSKTCFLSKRKEKTPKISQKLYDRTTKPTTTTVVLLLSKPSPPPSNPPPPPIISMITQTLIYYLSQHPSIVTFRWSHIQSWGSTWSFLLTSIAFYLTFCALVHLFLQIFIKRGRTVPLGPIPAAYSLFMALISVVIFSGILLSTAAEIQETRWFWRRSKTPFQWLLCFPLGTRPSGRVFFWSYMYYLSRYLHMFRTFFTILRLRKLVSFQLVNNSILTFMSFLWLEFSQSFQVLAILIATLVYSIIYGYRFWTAVGLPSACFPFVLNCQIVLLGCNVACHVGVLSLHFMKGGCNGIGAWWFNSVLNGAILFLFLNFYVKMYLGKRKEVISEALEEPEMMKVKGK